MGFENIFEEKSKRPEDVTSSQLFEICSGKFATQVEKLNSSDPSDSEFFMDSQHGEDSQVMMRERNFIECDGFVEDIVVFSQCTNYTLFSPFILM